MRNASYMLALLSAFVLMAAGSAWWGIFRQPVMEPTAGRIKHDNRRANSAAIATMAAFGLSLVAAILAVGGWIF